MIKCLTGKTFVYTVVGIFPVRLTKGSCLVSECQGHIEHFSHCDSLFFQYDIRAATVTAAEAWQVLSRTPFWRNRSNSETKNDAATISLCDYTAILNIRRLCLISSDGDLSLSLLLILDYGIILDTLHCFRLDICHGKMFSLSQ